MRNYTQQSVDMMSMLFTGVAGYLTWFGYEKGLEHLWPATIRAQQHMNGDDVIGTLSEGGGDWVHGKSEAYLKRDFFGLVSTYYPIIEQQNYISPNRNSAIGYVRNRSYNTYTNGCKDGYFPDIDFFEHHIYNMYHIKPNMQINVFQKKPLKIIDLLKKQNYYIDWYSYKDGNHLKTDYIKTSFNGTLKLKFPTLTSDENGNPVVWYVVHQNAYSGLIQEQTLIEERGQVLFEYQEVDNDTTSIKFKNSIYPNPFNNKIVVNSLEDDVFIITSLTGELIMTLSVHKGTNVINVQNLPRGLYLSELKKQHFITKIDRL